jgi:hypothetical protein
MVRQKTPKCSFLLKLIFIISYEKQVMDLVVKENLVLHERRISLSEFHAADEVRYFILWTFHLALLLRFFFFCYGTVYFPLY